MHLSSLFIYPVKSLRGCSLAIGEVDGLGLVGDRRFMVVDEGGRFLTQRTIPQMALIDTAIVGSQLILSRAGHGVSVSTLMDDKAPLRAVSIWSSSELEAEDCGDEVAHWLGSTLNVQCRLVRIGASFRRPVAKSPQDSVSFADAYPLLVLGESALADLNDRLQMGGGESLTMASFRPNLVFSGGGANEEDSWRRFRIGSVVFRTGGPCSRCTITTIDPYTGVRGFEPLRTLAGYRRNPADPADVIFGQNAVNETKSGTVRVGDTIKLLH